MCIAPRIPEIQDNLQLSNGKFGTFLALGAIGSMVALIIIGDVVHKIGVRAVLIGSASVMYGLIAWVPHMHSATLWFWVNIGIGFCISAFHISVNAQAIHRQEETGELLLPRFHGLWSSGAVTSAAIALVITDFTPLTWHIDGLLFICWTVSMYAIYKLNPILMGPAPADDEHPATSLKSILASFTFEPLVNFGMLMAIQIEFMVNDWATIYAKKTLHMGASISILIYFVFVISMISIRFSINRLFTIRPERFWMFWNPIVGGIGFLTLLLTGAKVAHSHQTLGFIITLIAFIFAGVGCSFILPGFFGIAARRSNLPGGVVVARLGLVNTVLVLLVKLVISSVAAKSVTAAFIIPGVMLILTAATAFLGSNEKQVRA